MHVEHAKAEEIVRSELQSFILYNGMKYIIDAATRICMNVNTTVQ